MRAESEKPDQIPASKANRPSWLKGILIAIVIGLAVNAGIGLFMDHGELLDNLGRVSWYLIIVPLCTQISTALIDTVRTWVVVRGMQRRITWSAAFMNATLGWFFNLVTPMAAGGQPFQVYHMTTQGLSSRAAANVILSRFVVNALLLVIMIGFAIPAILDIGGRLPASAPLFYAGLTITVGFSIVFLIILVNPLIIGRFALRSRHSRFGKFVAKISKKPRWSLQLLQWSHKLRREVVFLWSERFGYMIIDVILNLALILVQGWALYFVLVEFTGADISFWQAMVSYVIVWQTVFYIPTPGASGSLEAVFTLVFSGLTMLPEKTLVAVFAWRIGSYYLFLIFGLIVLFLYLRQQRLRAVQEPET